MSMNYIYRQNRAATRRITQFKVNGYLILFKENRTTISVV